MGILILISLTKLMSLILICLTQTNLINNNWFKQNNFILIISLMQTKFYLKQLV